MIILDKEVEQQEVLTTLMALEAKSKELYRHSVYVGHLSAMLCKIFSTNGSKSPPYCEEDVFVAGLLHDVGKLYVSDSILSKDSGLTEREMETMMLHPEWGYKYLLNIETLKHLAPYILQHHEHPNGGGYPNRLDLHQIHPIARIINIADRFSAMVEDRPYRKAISTKSSVALLHDDIQAFFGNASTKVIDYLLSLSVNALRRLENTFTTEVFVEKIY